MNVFDVLKYDGVKQDSNFESLLIGSIQSYISDGYHIIDHASKNFKEDWHGIALENEVSKILLSNKSGSVVEIVATKNQFIHQITTHHTSKTSTKPNGWSIKTTTTTLECTR